MLREFLIVGLGSFLGGGARYAVGCVLPAVARIPLSTMAVNVVGCFLIGLFNALLTRHGCPSASLRLFLTTGFCGGFTTFSTFVNENFLLLRGQHFMALAAYVVLSLFLGFVALYIGYHVAQ